MNAAATLPSIALGARASADIDDGQPAADHAVEPHAPELPSTAAAGTDPAFPPNHPSEILVAAYGIEACDDLDILTPDDGRGTTDQTDNRPQAIDQGSKSVPREPAVDVLARIAARARIFPGSDDRFYAEIVAGDHEETHDLRSPSFRRWLIREYRKETRGFAPVEALNNLIAALEADAEDASPTRPVFVRVGGDLSDENATIYLDLGDADRRSVAITAAGWEIVFRAGVAFRRPRGMRALPAPEAGGSLELLKSYINLDDDEFLLLIGWLATALRPAGPYPILVLNGEQGSAKTTLSRIVRKLVDPHVSPLAGEPREPRDLMVAAKNGWTVALDNISSLPPWLSDCLCRLATGGGLHVRTLYSNDEASFLDAMRPIVVNGIDDFVRRGDLSDRSVYLHPPAIRDIDRRLERKLMLEFDRDHPLILGALLDAVAGGLRLEPMVPAARLPRMADFAHFAESVCQALGHAPGSFLAAYDRNRQAASDSLLDDSPVARAFREFADRVPSWTGTASELLDELTALAGPRALASKTWPKTPKGLSAIIRRLAPQLRRDRRRHHLRPRPAPTRHHRGHGKRGRDSFSAGEFLSWRTSGNGRPEENLLPNFFRKDRQGG